MFMAEASHRQNLDIYLIKSGLHPLLSESKQQLNACLPTFTYHALDPLIAKEQFASIIKPKKLFKNPNPNLSIRMYYVER